MLNELSDIRAKIRGGLFTSNTSGIMPGLVQGNLVIMSKRWADEFLEFCHMNSKPCPVIGVSAVGNPALPELGDDLDICVDVPEYHIYENGQLVEASPDIKAHWRRDSVAIVLGCSFSFEDALKSAGLPVRNIELDTNVSMYDTNIATKATQHFACNMVVSMRPYKRHQIDEVVSITSAYSKAHGAPVHIGDPEAIGISDIHAPDYGSSIPLEHDDVPVFWACGVTTQAAIKSAKLPKVITHAPGKMLITNRLYEELGAVSA